MCRGGFGYIKIGGLAIFNIPKAIYLYDEGISDFDFNTVKRFIEDNFGRIKISLIKLEEKEKVVQTRGLLFDFLGTQNNFSKLKYSKENTACHIILTNKLFATIDQDNRPHIRASIYSSPSVISISGIVEGPAKPKDYYLYKQKYTILKVWEIEEPKVKRKFKDRFIDYNDKRMNEVLKGCISQSIFFYITGNPFCEDKKCRLFNAHWQEDLIYTQITNGNFCFQHKKMLGKIRDAVTQD